MVKSRDISEIQLHKFPWKLRSNPTKKTNIVGWDTETNNGWAFLLTKSGYGKDEAFKIESFDDFLSIIWNRKYQESINFYYNLDFDFAALSKHLGAKALETLALANYAEYEGMFLKWIPSKSFTISMSKKYHSPNGEIELRPYGRNVQFFDIAQFYNTSLAVAAEKVDETKLEFDTEKIDYQRFLNDDDYHNKLLEYGIQDAVICRKLGERLFHAVNKFVPVYDFYSTASIAQAYFLHHIPYDLKLPPEQVMDSALKSYGGGRFELIRRGTFENCYEIDINSAYPKVFSELVATGTKRGKWKIAGKEYDQDAHYGFYQIETETYDSLLSPIMHHTNHSVLYPHGKHEAWIEKSELEQLQKMGFKYKIHNGYEYFDDAPVYPFRFINELYADRLKLKAKGHDDLQYVVKIILNSAYGKTIQLIPKTKIATYIEDGDEDKIEREIELDNGQVRFLIRQGWLAGKMFNPVLAAAITARTRANLLQTVQSYNLEDSLIGFATDCLFLRKKPPQNLLGDGLGSWKLEMGKDGPAKGLFIGSGVYSIQDESRQINKLRGFRTKQNLFETMQNNFMEVWSNGESEKGLVFDITTPIKLKKAIRGGRLSIPNPTNRHLTSEIKIDWQDIGRFIEQRKVLDLNFDKKRVWDFEVKEPKDLLENEIDSKAVIL